MTMSSYKSTRAEPSPQQPSRGRRPAEKKPDSPQTERQHKTQPHPAESKSAHSSAKAKILVVDDHPLVRDWISKLVNEQPDLCACGGAGDAHEALAQTERLKPDMVISDISLNQTSGIDLIKDLKIRHPKIPVLVLSMHSEELYAERALRAGALGYITKQAPTESVLGAIRQVLRGEMYLSGDFAAMALQKFFRGRTARTGLAVDQLSDRELEIFELIGHGRGSHEIAERLHISFKTVETYRTRLKEKLNLSSARELLQRAVQWVLSEGH